MNILGLDNIDPTTRALISMGSNLLQASGPSRMPVSLGQALGGAMGNTMSTLDQATHMGIQNKLQKQEIEKNKMLMDQAKQHQEMMAQLPSILAPTVDVNSTGGPKNSMDTRAMTLLSTGDPTLQTMGLKMLSGQGGQYGVSPVYGTDAQGNPVILQMNSAGGASPVPLPPGVTVSPPMQYKDIGGGVVGLSSRGTGVQSYIPKTLPPEKAPGYLTQAELAKGQGQTEAKRAAAEPMAKTNLAAQSAKTTMLDGLIDKAKGQANTWTTGFIGQKTQDIGGTPAHDLQNTLYTIKANIGFDKLQQLRDSSPTGGALGQVSEFENRLLQSVWGALEQSQTPEQFKFNLDMVKKQVHESWKRVGEAYKNTYGKEIPASLIPTSSQNPSNMSDEQIKRSLGIGQ